jgi:ParB-like chromosome segregation protein Spo0J
MGRKPKAQNQNTTSNPNISEALTANPLNDLAFTDNPKLLGTAKYSLVPLRSLISNPENPRVITLEDQDIKELADSILTVGLIQPLVVQVIELPDGEKKYIVHAGNRRYHALLLAEQILLKKVHSDEEMSHEEADQLTCIQGTVPVMEYSGDYAALPLIENGMRKDLDPIFESNYIVKCINQNKDFEHWAKQFGRSHVWVRQRYELRKLVPEVKEFEGKGISLKQLLEVAKRPAAEQLKFAKAAKERFDKENKPSGEVHISDILWKSESTIHWPEEIQFAGSPSCKGCEFNSSTFNTLFNDGNGRAGTCYNKECFKTKDILYKQSLKIQAKNILEYLQANGYPDAILLDFDAPNCYYDITIEGIGEFSGYGYTEQSVLWALENHNSLHIVGATEANLGELLANLDEKPNNLLVIIRNYKVYVDAYKQKTKALATPATNYKPDLTTEEINFEEVNAEILEGFKDAFYGYLQGKTWYQNAKFITIPDFSKLALPTIDLLEESYKEFHSEYSHRIVVEEEIPAPSETQEAE